MRASISPITRETRRDNGEVIRQFNVVSALEVLAASLGAIFLVLYLLAFLPWILVKGTTAAVEGLMSRIGFGDFSADTIWSWLLVLIVGAVFVLFLVAILGGILILYNLLSHRTGYGLPVRNELLAGTEPLAVTAAGEPAPEPEPEPDLDASFDELYAEAQRRNITGRSSMSKAELEAALAPNRRRARKSTSKRATKSSTTRRR